MTATTFTVVPMMGATQWVRSWRFEMRGPKNGCRFTFINQSLDCYADCAPKNAKQDSCGRHKKRLWLLEEVRAPV